MSKFRLLASVGVLAIWAVIILPLWLIGLGYEADGFRFPTIGKDRLNDVVIFYAPLVGIACLAGRKMLKSLKTSEK